MRRLLLEEKEIHRLEDIVVDRTITRVPMPIRKRAKQFAMFDAMKGLTEAIAEKEKRYIQSKECMEKQADTVGFYRKETITYWR